jgi:hypothetical protein
MFPPALPPAARRWPVLLLVALACASGPAAIANAQPPGLAAAREAPASTQAAQANTGPFRLLTDPPAGEYVFLIAVSEGQRIKLVVQDENRRQVVQEELVVPANTRQVAVATASAPAGRYFVQLSTFTGTYVKNIVVD